MDDRSSIYVRPAGRAEAGTPMTVVLTGATGFLGRVVARRLAVEHTVVALHRPGSTPPEIEGVRWQQQDLASGLSSALPSQIDAVIHLAQSRGYRHFPDTAVDVFEINAGATLRLIDYCRQAGGTSFTYASSGSVYARGPRPVSEHDVPRPEGLYAASKLAGELAIESFRGLLAVHALRFFSIYGPGQQNMLIPGVLGRISTGQAVTLPGRDGFRVNPVFVEDAAQAVVATLGLSEGHTLNVAGPNVVSIRELAELGADALGVHCQFENVGPADDMVADIGRQSSLLGTPTVGVAEGLRRTVAAARDAIAR